MMALAAAACWVAGACGGPSEQELPSGDNLDRIINHLAISSDVENELVRCVTAQGVPFTADEVDAAFGQTKAEDEPGQVGSSGIVEAYTDPDSARPPDTPLTRALEYRVRLDGVTYEHGCMEYISTVLADSPAEQLRQQLFDAYGEAIVNRATSDERWIAAEAAWATCMAEQGFPGYTRPGEQFTDIIERLNAAHGDQQAMREVENFDRAVTRAAESCNETLEIHDVVANEMREWFVSEHEDDLTTLMLLLEN
jgi:hypothetical protein